MIKQPTISIIIPTYNRAKLIGETLDSISKQTYIDWECIIVDDGSKDNTEAILRSYIENDPRFQYHKRPSNRKKGANACRNYGFELSKGKFINWFDDDDLMHPENLEKKVRSLKQNTRADYCICKTQAFNEIFDPNKLSNTPKPIPTMNIYEDYVLGNCSIMNNVPLWRKSIFTDNELYDESLHQLQDLDFFSRIIFKNRKVTKVDEVLVFQRRNNESITTKNKNLKINTESNLEVRKRIIERTPENYKIVLFNIRSVLGIMRYKMAAKNYVEAHNCLRFVLKYTSLLKFRDRLKLIRVKFAFFILKLIRTGDTRLKPLLKI